AARARRRRRQLPRVRTAEPRAQAAALARAPVSVESRVIWLFGSPRSGSTWLRQMAAEHPAVEVMDEPTIGYHLSPFLSNEPGYHPDDLYPGTSTLRRVVEDSPDGFFPAKYEDV